MASSLSEPPPRFAHYSAALGGQLYVWGGRTKDFSKENKQLSVSVHTFDQCLKTWHTKVTTGKYPPGLYDGACTSTGHHLYLYGGYDGSQYCDSLFQLNTNLLEWSQLPSGPMKKAGCGMVSYENKLILFGGYGIPLGTIQRGAEFIEYDDDTDNHEVNNENHNNYDSAGWINELHMFDIQKREWSSPIVTGTRPPPCSHFSLTKMDQHRPVAVLFGGYYGPTHGCSNHVYVLDLEKIHWSVLESSEEPWPAGRTCHAAVCLRDGGNHPQLLVTGGRCESKRILSDTWILDLKTKNWKEVDVPGFQARCWHSAYAFVLCPKIMEVTLFGGCPEWLKSAEADLSQIANTTVLRIEYSDDGSSWILADMADSSQLGTRQRIEEKAAKMIQAISTSPATPKPSSGDINNQVAERRVQEVEERCRDAEKQLKDRRVRAAEDRAREAEGRATKAEIRAANAEKSLHEAMEEKDREVKAAVDRAKEIAEEKVVEGNERLREVEERGIEGERRLKEAERRLREAEGRVVEGERRLREAESRAAEGERRLREAERRAAEGERRLREAESRAAEGERRLREAERRAAEGERRLREAEGRAAEGERRLREAEGRAAEGERRLREAEGRAAEAERRLRETEGRASEGERRQKEAEEKRKLKEAEDGAAQERKLREAMEKVQAAENKARETEEGAAGREMRLRAEGEKKLKKAEDRATEGEKKLAAIMFIAS